MILNMTIRTKKEIVPSYKLPDRFWTFPTTATDRVTRKELKELLLNGDRLYFAWGKAYELVYKHLGVGVYEISFKKKIYKSEGV